MTTSGTINQTMIASEVIRMAMGPGALGILSAGETPTGEDVENGLLVLSFMLKDWAADGLSLWREAQGSVTFPAGTATVQLAPYAIDVVEARFVQSPTFERPLLRWETGQYQQLPNKAQPGTPTGYKLTKATSALSMTLWPVPFVDVTVRYTYARVTEDVTSGEQTLDLPQEWTQTVWLNLASRLASSTGATRTDPATVQRVDAMAGAAYQRLLDADRPASIFMGPSDARYW